MKTPRRGTYGTQGTIKGNVALFLGCRTRIMIGTMFSSPMMHVTNMAQASRASKYFQAFVSTILRHVIMITEKARQKLATKLVCSSGLTPSCSSSSASSVKIKDDYFQIFSHVRLPYIFLSSYLSLPGRHLYSFSRRVAFSYYHLPSYLFVRHVSQ